MMNTKSINNANVKEEKNMNFNQMLLSEFRLVPVNFNTDFSEENLVKAITANEELKQVGYTLKPADIIQLAKSSNLNSFVQEFRGLLGDVKAKPMYPNFPTQVMGMDEAVFRFHQMLHYFSTYGVEFFTGVEVSKGWLPEVEDTEKIKDDTTLLDAKVVTLIAEDDKFVIPYRKILSRNERMTDKDRLIMIECLKNLTPHQMVVNVAFKQNALLAFDAIFTSELDSDQKFNALKGLCQHTGDIWKCVDYSLTRADFHFKTSQKKLIVKLLESYDLNDFRANLVLSAKKGARVILVLQYLSYNTYSRKDEYKQAVADLRSGKLSSWEAEAKMMVSYGVPEALPFIAKRPGMMIRMLTYLLRNGYSVEDITANLVPNSGSLKTQTIISLLNFFGKKKDESDSEEASKVYSIAETALMSRMSAMDTPLRNKKVYLDVADEFDLDHSELRVTDKSSEGGYIRSGFAYKIPDNVKRLRFFVYWNDEQRVDVDLHGAAVDKSGDSISIGWNGDYDKCGIVFSGDITHSNAAEFIDIDLETDVAIASFNINLYSGKSAFGEIEECYVGCMAVDQLGQKVKLYNPKNCFFTHYLTGKYRTINYGYVDVVNRCIVFDGNQANNDWYSVKDRNLSYPLSRYINDLLSAQSSVVVNTPEEADICLVMGKPSRDNDVSLIDNNLFLEA